LPPPLTLSNMRKEFEMKIQFLLFVIVIALPTTVFSKTPSEISLEQLRQFAGELENQGVMSAADDLKNLEKAFQNASRSAGLEPLSIKPGQTPEEEIKRRREIVNSSFDQYGASVSAYSLGVSETLGNVETATSPKRSDERSLIEMEDEGGGVGSTRDDGKVRSDADALKDAIVEAERAKEKGGSVEDASVASNQSGFEPEMSSKKNADLRQFPPKAMEIKGKVVISGGDASMSNNRKIEEIDYRIEEALVGNILVSETKDEKTGKVAEREYLIDTISKNIEVKSLSGEKCLSLENASASTITCDRSTPYIKSSIDRENRYPGFSSNVVFLDDDGDKVKIAIDPPKVNFSTLLGEGGASVNCGDVEFELSKKEFQRMIDRGKIVLKKKLEKTPGCKEGSSVEISLIVSK